MYDINTRNIKKRWGEFCFTLIVCLSISTMFGFYLFSYLSSRNSFDSNVASYNTEVNSYIDYDHDGRSTTMYSSVYYYQVDDKEYRCASDASSSTYPGTENKLVYYDSKEPSNCMVERAPINYVLALLGILIPLFLIAMETTALIRNNKHVKNIKKLNSSGKLIKNLPYRLEDSATFINDTQLAMPVVDYTLPSGVTVSLPSNIRYSNRTHDAKGTVDLVIDENNPENYYIDFEINRIGGNLPQDYYQQTNSTITPNQDNHSQIQGTHEQSVDPQNQQPK